MQKSPIETGSQSVFTLKRRRRCLKIGDCFGIRKGHWVKPWKLLGLKARICFVLSLSPHTPKKNQPNKKYSFSAIFQSFSLLFFFNISDKACSSFAHHSSAHICSLLLDNNYKMSVPSLRLHPRMPHFGLYKENEMRYDCNVLIKRKNLISLKGLWKEMPD